MMYLVALACFTALAVACTAALLLWQLFSIYVRRRWVSRIRLPALTAYTDDYSFQVGDEVALRVHTTAGAAVKLVRMGEQPTTVDWKTHVPPQIQSNRYDFWHGLSWDVSVTIPTESLSSGVYVIRLEQEFDPDAIFQLPIILSPSEPVDVAVIASTNTWEAYNAFGGLSNYQDSVTPAPLRWLKDCLILLNLPFTIGDRRHVPMVPLPFHRPNSALNEDLTDLERCPTDSPSHLLRAEWQLWRLLEGEGVKYGVYSDRDFCRLTAPATAKLTIFNCHSEYWSEEMIGHLSMLRTRDKCLAFVSGNNIYRRVEFLEKGLAVYDFKTDRSRVSRLIGAAYNAHGYKTYGSYRVVDSSHWVFAGLNLNIGDEFAGDTSDPSRSGMPGASGYETDKITAESGEFRLLAIGTNVEGPAAIVIRETANGGWIFNTSSVASAPWVNQDAVLSGMMRNLVDNALELSKKKEALQAA